MSEPTAEDWARFTVMLPLSLEVITCRDRDDMAGYEAALAAFPQGMAYHPSAVELLMYPLDGPVAMTVTDVSPNSRQSWSVCGPDEFARAVLGALRGRVEAGLYAQDDPPLGRNDIGQPQFILMWAELPNALRLGARRAWHYMHDKEATCPGWKLGVETIVSEPQSLSDYWREAEVRAQELGLDTPEAQEAMRNPGTNRTLEKRELVTLPAVNDGASRVRTRLPPRYSCLSHYEVLIPSLDRTQQRV